MTKVLYVERDDDNLYMLKTRLERVGDFEVLAAEDSEEGCRLAAIHPAAGQDRAPPGKHTVNTDPLPGSLVTVTSPPIMRASLRVMARPRPVPPNRCAVACLNLGQVF